jgi:hypothetical protein
LTRLTKHLLTETLVTFLEAARRLPPGRRGRPVSSSCVYRWTRDGIRGPDGQRVCLEAVRIGGRWLTSLEAMQRFAERLTPQLDAGPAPAPRSPAARQRASERAEKLLEKEGF